jgi:NAD(P)H dehydrogenase (quinone)
MKSKILIIYAHPNKDGFCGEILKNVIKNVKNCEILDLYAMNYNPILQNEEHFTSGHYEVSKENKKIQEKIKNCDKFIFIYPTWWQNMPAILKGFIDRIFTPKFAYKYEGNFPKGLLSGKALVFTTTGAPKIYSLLFKCNRSLKVLTKDTLSFCGIKSKGYVIGSANHIDEKRKEELSKLVKKSLKYLD